MEKEFKLGGNQMSTNRDTVEINKRAIFDGLSTDDLVTELRSRGMKGEKEFSRVFFYHFLGRLGFNGEETQKIIDFLLNMSSSGKASNDL